jgi:predicted Rossmann fold flavoprotein
LVKKHNIAYYEKTLGQLFCVGKSQEIVNMLCTECEQAGVKIQLNTQVKSIKQLPNLMFELKTKNSTYHCKSLVIATGGLSIPTLGASPFAYHVAEQFDIRVYPTRAGLVPFTLNPEDKQKLAPLSGIGVPSIVSNQKISFKEALLFTHRGLSGPAILQLSSYWTPGETISINLLPEHNVLDILQIARKKTPKKQLNSVLCTDLPRRLIDVLIPKTLAEKTLADLSNQALETIAELIQNWTIKPDGTEGYRTAEVTLGGIDCNAISSKTMETQNTSGLYFIGEALDITGLLGGYNFQWAWSSGFAAGQVV